jgi:hypothetical protein
MTLFPSRQEAFHELFSRRFLFPPGVIICAGSPIYTLCAGNTPLLAIPIYRFRRFGKTGKFLTRNTGH